MDLVNGSGNLVLNDLDFGYYSLNAVVYDNDYASELSSNFNITISKTRIIANDLISYYTFEKDYSIVLEDVYGNPVINRQVSFIINGKSYVGTTDEEGRASVLVKLNSSTTYYKVSVLFYGDNNYFETNIDSNIYLKPSIMLPDATNFIAKSDYCITFLDFNGNPLTVGKANIITVDGVEYWEINDNTGKVIFNLNLKVGSHVITVKNALTGEKVSCKINVVNRIMQNTNINTYYLTNAYYKVRVYGANGNIAKAGEIVKITINKKTYSVKVGSNGYASFKISLNPGTYTITASYGGYKVSNKVVVKPLLITKNLSVKKAKLVKYNVKLINNKGKALKGKIITFKFKGRTYYAKTNANGIATLKMNNLNAGIYKIISKYGKSSCTNTINIKK